MGAAARPPSARSRHVVASETTAAAAAVDTRRAATVTPLPLRSTATRQPTRRVAPAWQGRLVAWLLGALSIGGVLLFWHLATLYKLDLYVRFNNIPTPADVFAKVIEVNQSSAFLTNIGISVRRILLGFAAATLLGVALGVLVGRYTRVRQLTFPALEVFRPIPAIAWVPMSIMLWPSNEVSIVFITFLGAFFPILLNTIHGVEGLDPVLLRAARSLGAKEPSLLLRVVLPGAMPHIFTGLAVGMGVAWVSLIAAEMISGQFGIGYFTWEAYSLISYAEIALGMITIGVLGLLCSGAIRLVAKLSMPWSAFSSNGGRA